MRDKLIAAVAGILVLLAGVAVGSRLMIASADEYPVACLAALQAADGVADMLEGVAPNPGAAFDLTYHELERSGYRDLAAECRDQL